MDLKRFMALADLAAETKAGADELKEAIAALSLTGALPPELLDALALGAEERLMRNPDFPVRADMLGEAGVVVGIEQSVDRPLTWSDHTKSVLIMGAIGVGKTNLVSNIITQLVGRGVTCWIFDRRGDYIPLLTSTEAAYIIPWNQLRVNAMAPPPGVSLESWLGTLSEAFSHTYSLLTGSKSLFEEVLHLVWEEASGEGRIPTFLDVCHRFARRDYVAVRTRTDADYRGRIYDRLRLLRRKAAKILSCEVGFDLVSLARCGKAVVFDVSAEEQFRDFLILVLMWHVWWHRKANRGDHPPLVFVLDEARYTLRERRGAQEHYILDIDQLATGARPFNIGFMIAEQVPSQLSKAVANNTQLKVAFNCQADEIPFVSRILGLSSDQGSRLRSLEVGQCIASLAGSQCPVPVLLRVPEFRGRVVDEDKLDAAVERTVSDLSLPVVVTKASKSELTEEEAILLAEVALHPFRGITEHMNAVGFSRSVFYRIQPALVARRCLETSKVSTRGRPMKLLEVTEKGRSLLEATSFTATREPYHGGVAHAYWLNELKARLEVSHSVEMCPQLSCGRIPDLLLDGVLAVEVEASDNAKSVAAKYEGILGEVDDLVVVVEEANAPGLSDAIERAVLGLPEAQRRRARVVKVLEFLRELP